MLLFLLVHFGIVRFNLFWKASPAIVLVLLLFGLLIPMGWGAPQGNALVVRNAVSIVPRCGGRGDGCSGSRQRAAEGRRCPVQDRPDALRGAGQGDRRAVPPKLAKTRLGQMTQLYERDAGRGFDVEQRQSEADQLSGQLEAAQWNLDKTVVRAPADGYVTNLALRKGARVANLPLAPVMAFIDVSSTIIGVEINQTDARYVAPGQEVEATFKFAPGQIYSGKVESVLQAIATGQVQTSGTAVLPKAIEAAPFVVRVKLDDADFVQAVAGRQRRNGGGSTPITSNRPTSCAA